MVDSFPLILLISVSESIECCCFSQRSKYWAEKTASIPSRVLEQTCITAVAQAPASISLKVSKEKVEKVVNPPQMPTFKKSTALWSRSFPAAAAIQPIAKAPRMFMIKVFSGKEPSTDKGSLLIMKRHTDPIKPPRPTIRQSVIAGFLQLNYATINILTLFLPCRKGNY